jgi:hypothetical protein
MKLKRSCCWLIVLILALLNNHKRAGITQEAYLSIFWLKTTCSELLARLLAVTAHYKPGTSVKK